MSAGTFLCDAHHADATEFCLCGQTPAYLCATCVPQHADKSSHDAFPLEYFELFGALGNDKAELKRRIEKVKVCRDFLDKTTASQAAIVTEANGLIADLAKCSQDWVEKNQRCFTTLVGNLREEVSSLLQTPQVALSPLAQTLVERNLSGQETLFHSIPAENALKEFTQRGHEAFAVKDSRLRQIEYEEKALREMTKLPPKIQQAVEQGDVQAPDLPCVQGDSLRFFNFGTKQWNDSQKLSTIIPFDEYTRYTLLGDSRVFCCGSDSNINTETKAANILARDGTVEQLQNMIYWHPGAGIVFVANRNSVYVFGSCNLEAGNIEVVGIFYAGTVEADCIFYVGTVEADRITYAGTVEAVRIF